MPAAAQSSVLLAMSAPPYWHCGRTVRRQSLMTLAALLPAVIGAVWTWGLPAVRVMSLCVAVAVLTEAACQKLMGRELAIDDYTAVCSGPRNIVSNSRPIAPQKIAPIPTCHGKPIACTTTKAKNAFRPIAGASATGRLANSPIIILPNAAIRQVVTKTALVSMPATPRICGLTKTM